MINNSFETILFEIKVDIGIITINRPLKLNALNEIVIEELTSCLTEVNKSHLNGIILTGTGTKAFIAGADIEAMESMDSVQAKHFCTSGQELTVLLENLKCPAIAAVNGFALGAGLEVALACDFIYASENASFALPEVGLGLIPGFGGTQRLAKIVGRNKAKEMIFTGSKLNAKDAVDAGLVLKTSESHELINKCLETMNKMQQNSPFAISRAKVALNKGIDSSNDTGLEIEKDIFCSLFESHDMKEGTKAFLEKRKPSFKGN